MCRIKASAIGLALLLPILATLREARADGISAVKACEGDNDPPEDVARLTILPNGEPRGSDTAAALITMARQKPKEGKDDEAIRWAALCNFGDQSEQEVIKRDRVPVLQYLKQ